MQLRIATRKAFLFMGTFLPAQDLRQLIQMLIHCWCRSTPKHINLHLKQQRASSEAGSTTKGV